MKRLILITALLLGILSLHTASADENGMVSPYSRYGFGSLNHYRTGFNSNMAGVGIGTQRGNELNPTNPASYAAIDSMTMLFDAGFSMQYVTMHDGKNRGGTGSFLLDYLAAGFRVTKGLGISIGLQPYSNVGYKISAEAPLMDSYDGANNLTITRTYYGSGGLREAYAGIGYAPVREFSMGVQGGYIWGNIDNASAVSYSNSSVEASSRLYESQIRTYNVRAGLQGIIPFTKQDWLTLGANYTLGHSVNSKSKMIVSLTDTTEVSNAFQLPHSFGAGLSYTHADNFRIAADYELQQWSGCKFPWLTTDALGGETYEAVAGRLTDSHRVALGLEYRPMKRGTKWHEYIRYRLGFAFTTPYTRVASSTGADIKGPCSYLVTAGASIPILNVFSGRSTVNVALQYERVQPSMPGQLKEDYFRLSLGINFNEQWFQKWKVN